MSRLVYLLNGPNLNLLGTREPQIYGTQSLTDVDARLAQEAVALGVEVVCVQHNAEGAIIDELHAARGRFDGSAAPLFRQLDLCVLGRPDRADVYRRLTNLLAGVTALLLGVGGRG